MRASPCALEHRTRGYDVGSGWNSDSELYGTDGRSRRVPEVRIAPRPIPGALKVVLKCRTATGADGAAALVKDSLPPAIARATVLRRKHLGGIDPL